MAADVTFRCRACGPLPLTSFVPSVLKRGRSGDCRACRKRANALHYAANRWRLRGAVAPGVCGPETDPKALVADVLSRAGRRCAITQKPGVDPHLPSRKPSAAASISMCPSATCIRSRGLYTRDVRSPGIIKILRIMFGFVAL